jgi:hypothetical protein
VKGSFEARDSPNKNPIRGERGGLFKLSDILYLLILQELLSIHFFPCLPAVLLEGQGEYRMSPFQEIGDTSQYDEYGEYVETDAKGVFALRVRGESMETEFHEGDIIVINPYLNRNTMIM